MINLSVKLAQEKLDYSGMSTMPLWERIDIELERGRLEIIHIPLGWIISRKGGEHSVFVRKSNEDVLKIRNKSKSPSFELFCNICGMEVLYMFYHKDHKDIFRCKRGHIEKTFTCDLEKAEKLRKKWR
jgi:hypothetical protein